MNFKSQYIVAKTPLAIVKISNKVYDSKNVLFNKWLGLFLADLRNFSVIQLGFFIS